MTNPMRAIHVIDEGPQSSLEIRDTEKPVPGSGELLVRVHATALNRADLLQRAGKYPPPKGASPLLGLEMAGTIESVGKACLTQWKEGARVFGLLPGGGYAEYVVIPEQMAMRIPSELSFEEAAAIPEVFLTAYQALYLLGEIKKGQRVLIHAGASGVGTAAIQMAALTGAEVYVTASAGKHESCLSLGARSAIDYRQEDFGKEIRRLTNGEGVDLVVDFIGAPYLKQNVDILSLDGRLVLLAFMGGSKVADFDLRTIFGKRIQILPSTLRSRDLAYKVSLTRVFDVRMLPQFLMGPLRPVIDQVFDWHDVEQAHKRMSDNLNIGKIVLRIS